jgi:hypothetical protein
MRRVLLTILIPASLLALPCVATAQVHVGPQLAIGTDSGLGLGGRLVFPLRVGILGMDAFFEGNYFFGGGRAVDSWIDTNANVRIPIPIARDFTTRIGGGLNMSFISLRGPTEPTTVSEREFGFNLLAGISLPHGHLAPFGEVRVVAGGAAQLVLTGGFTVGPRR